MSSNANTEDHEGNTGWDKEWDDNGTKSAILLVPNWQGFPTFTFYVKGTNWTRESISEITQEAYNYPFREANFRKRSQDCTDEEKLHLEIMQEYVKTRESDQKFPGVKINLVNRERFTQYCSTRESDMKERLSSFQERLEKIKTLPCDEALELFITLNTEMEKLKQDWIDLEREFNTMVRRSYKPCFSPTLDFGTFTLPLKLLMLDADSIVSHLKDSKAARETSQTQRTSKAETVIGLLRTKFCMP